MATGYTLSRSLKRTALALVCLFGLAISGTAVAQITVTGSHLQDSSGNPLSNATITFAPVDASGNALPYRAGGSTPGQVVVRPVSSTVTSGAFTLSAQDTSLTSPIHVCYAVSVVDNVTGESLLGTGYNCVQPSSTATSWCSTSSGVTSCNFDNYVPSTPGLTPTETGPVGPAGSGGSGGSGCTVSGSTNTLQKNNGSGSCAASSITDNGTTVTTPEAVAAGSYGYAPLTGVCYVSEGDSTSAGAFMSSPSTQNWGYQLSQLPFFKNRSTFLLAAVSGSTWETMTSRYVSTVQPYKPGGTHGCTKSYLSILIGRNDLNESPSTVEAGVAAYIAQAKSDGFTVILASQLPSTTLPTPTLTTPTCNITAVSASSTTSTNTFTCTNSFVAGQQVYVTQFSPTATITGTQCTATAVSVASGVTTIYCSTPPSAGSAVYLTGFTGVGTFLNTLWTFVTTSSAGSFTIAYGSGTTSMTSVSGTVSASTGAGINIGGNVLTVSATGLSTSQWTTTSGPYGGAVYGGGNYTSQSNTATASSTGAYSWDPLTPSQWDNQVINQDWSRSYPTCNVNVTTGCVDYFVDTAQLLRDPSNSPTDTGDGTHESAAFAAKMAQYAETVVTNSSPSLPQQPIISGVQPIFYGVTTANIAVQEGATPSNPVNNNPYWSVGYSSGFVENNYDPTSAVYVGHQYNASSHTFACENPLILCATLNSSGQWIVPGSIVSYTNVNSDNPSNHNQSVALYYSNGVGGVAQSYDAGSSSYTPFIFLSSYVGIPSLVLASGTAMTANQGNGAYLQHSTGAITPNDCTKFDSYGNTVDAGIVCGGGESAITGIRYGNNTGADTVATSSQMQSAIGSSVYDPYGTAATDLTTAETYSANANNISSGTLNHSRLPTLLSADIPANAANTSGNAATATALAATPSNCSTGQAPTGIAASGAAQNCTTYTQTICSGTISLGTSAIASGAAAADATATCTGLATTDVIQLGFNGSPSAVTGYAASANGMLTVYPYPASNTIHVSVVNTTAASITPGAITMNYRVVR